MLYEGETGKNFQTGRIWAGVKEAGVKKGRPNQGP